MTNNGEKMTETLDESKAFNKITLDLLEQKRKEHFRLWIVILVLAAVNLIEFGIFAWYVSTEEVVTTTTTTTVEQDANSGEGNNVYQSGERAVYNDKGSD